MKTYLVLISVLYCLFSSTPAHAQRDTILTEAEQMPYFPGCTDYKEGSEEKRLCSNQNLVAFIANNMTYPADAKDSGIEGTVIVSFVVNEHGHLEEKQIIKDIGGGCGAAAIAILDEMPRWQAGRHKGTPVKVQLTLPLTFSLKLSEAESTQDHSIAWGQIRGSHITKEVLRANIHKEIIVRDQFGNTMPISQLTISFEKGSRYLSASSNGNITKDVEKILKKAKNGGELVLIATVHRGGDFIAVERKFTVD